VNFFVSNSERLVINKVGRITKMYEMGKLKQCHEDLVNFKNNNQILVYFIQKRYQNRSSTKIGNKILKLKFTISAFLFTRF